MPLTRYNNLLSDIIQKSGGHRTHVRSTTKTDSKQQSKILSQLDVKSLLLELIRCDNDSILEQILLHLNHLDNTEDKELLNCSEVLTRLLKLLQRKESTKCLIKLTLKLMTSLVKTESGAHLFCDDSSNLKVLLDLLKIKKRGYDPIVLELVLYILSRITIYTKNSKYWRCDLSVVLRILREHDDIDIKYNCIQILENMFLNDKNVFEWVWDEEIPLETVYTLFVECGVERVQSSCLNLMYLINRNTDDHINEIMDLFGGFNKSFDTVESWEYENQKTILMYLIGTFPLEYMNTTALKKLVVLMRSHEHSPDFIRPCLNILVKMCTCNIDMINLLNIGQVLVELLSSETINIKLYHAACEGVRILCETDNTEYMQHVSRISSNRHILDHMFEILGTGEVESGYKTSIGRLLFVLMNDDIFCKDMNNETQDHNHSDTTLSRSGTLLVLDKDRIRIMLGIGLDSEDNELSSIMLRCVYKLTKGYACIGDKQIDTIIKYFRYNQKNQTNSKTEILLEILNISLSRPAVANFFIKNSCLQVVDEWMKDQSDPELLIAYGNLLLNACQYTPLSQIINELKTFQWMNKHNLCQDEPLWNHIISRLLSINLSLKFAFNNTLDVMNITSEGFYVFKHLKHVNLFDFPSLGKILRENDKNKIVYVFTRDQNVSFRDKHIEKYIADISILLRDSNHISLKTSMPMSEHSLLLSNPEESEQFDVEMKLNMKQDLEIIATYVRNQMIGHEDHDQIDQDLLDEHLEEIITEHNSNVIPIGHVKIGLQFERSLLFKILCDVFGYPCTLVRDEYQNMSYNQVCIDLDDNDNLMQDNARQVFYYHVDLMSNPPQLIPLQGLSE